MKARPLPRTSRRPRRLARPRFLSLRSIGPCLRVTRRPRPPPGLCTGGLQANESGLALRTPVPRKPFVFLAPGLRPGCRPTQLRPRFPRMRGSLDRSRLSHLPEAVPGPCGLHATSSTNSSTGDSVPCHGTHPETGPRASEFTHLGIGRNSATDRQRSKNASSRATSAWIQIRRCSIKIHTVGALGKGPVPDQGSRVPCAAGKPGGPSGSAKAGGPTWTRAEKSLQAEGRWRPG